MPIERVIASEAKQSQRFAVRLPRTLRVLAMTEGIRRSIGIFGIKILKLPALYLV